MMRLHQAAASRRRVGMVIVSVSAIAIIGGSHDYEGTVAAQQTTTRPPVRPPLVDEYYPVKYDWIGDDRTILTIKHVPTASCYVLIHPSGDTLMQVEKERCAGLPAVER